VRWWGRPAADRADLEVPAVRFCAIALILRHTRGGRLLIGHPLVASTATGRLRYDNALPLRLVSRLVGAFSDPGELVVDQMLGSGTTPIAAHLAARRFIGGDLNPAAIRFAAARLLDEQLWPAWRQPALFAV
jgi:methylase of polypeptide subunit release factors